MGLRHRAALGTSEVSDSVSVVVSEETGMISITTGGRMITRLDADRLQGVLNALFKTDAGSQSWVQRLTEWFPFIDNQPPASQAGAEQERV